ncbi:MAG: hypothetical protein QXE64_01280 [Candidatus Pacearchaeota archaeon]
MKIKKSKLPSFIIPISIIFLFTFIFLSSFVLAQGGLNTPLKTPSWLKWLFGFSDVTTIGQLLLFILLILIFTSAFVDILALTAPFFSRRTVLIISIGLSAIIALSRALTYLASLLLGLAAALGTFAVAAEIGIAFIIFIALAWCSDKAFKWALKRKVKAEALKGAVEPAKAWQKLQKFEELTG